MARGYTAFARPALPAPFMPSIPGADAPANILPAGVSATLPRCTRELLILVDAEGLLRWCNPPVETLLGRSLAQLAGIAWHDALSVAPSQRHALECALAPWAQGQPGAGLEIEVEIAPAAVAPACLRIAAHALAADGPQAAGATRWLLVMQDITEARRCEGEARRLSELLEMAQEFGRIGVWERQIPSGAGRWDRHVFGFWGMDPAHGTPSYAEAIEHIHPDDRARMSYLTTTQRAGRYMQRYRILRADGSTRWIQSQWEVKNAPSGEPERAIGIMMDDTDVFELARSLGDTSAQLKLAIELGNIAIWRHDLQTGRVHYNDRATRVLGVPSSVDGLALQELRALVHPDDVAQLAVSAQQAFDATDRPIDIEARFASLDGGYRTALLRRVLERSADGTPRAWVGIALDVTDQAEERRRSTELMRRMEAAAAAAGVGIWSYDEATGERQWNETMFALVGRPLALGPPSRREWEEAIVHPADRDRMRNSLEGLFSGRGGYTERRYRVALSSGEIRWLQSRVRGEYLDGRRTVFGVTLDITDRHRAEDALRNADERAALAARGAGIGTWEMDLTGSGERWDAQMFHLRGLEPRERPPARDERLALLHPDDAPRVIDSRAHAATDPEPAQYEFRVRWPDGHYRWLASRSVAVLDEAGRPLRRIGVNWDITEAKRAEATRQEIVLAQRENLAKSRFLSRISHELRTPLNAVLGFTQLLQSDAGLTDGQRTRLGWIHSAGEHLLLLINDMLDLSGLESGDQKLLLEPLALADLVRDTLPLVEPLAVKHGVALRLGAADGVALADRTRLRQVLINLLTNGIKYNHPQGWVAVAAASAGGRVTLDVSDSGRGLAPEQVAHLFEPFNRLGAEREGVEGSGIGLVIVKTLVERMGGTVRVSSQPGHGTRFSIELPAAPAAPRPDRPATAGAAPAPRAAPGPGRLLYIEDNPVNMLLVEELVAMRPAIEMISATNGEHGVRQAIERLPALVLVDMQLPDFDGFEVLRRLRADPRTAALRCVALSANALPEDIARALAAGFADYWTKPIDFGHFLAALDAVFAPGPTATD